MRLLAGLSTPSRAVAVARSGVANGGSGVGQYGVAQVILDADAGRLRLEGGDLEGLGAERTGAGPLRHVDGSSTGTPTVSSANSDTVSCRSLLSCAAFVASSAIMT